MAYTKPQVIAQNASSGSYAAGCPANTRTWTEGGGSVQQIQEHGLKEVVLTGNVIAERVKLQDRLF